MAKEDLQVTNEMFESRLHWIQSLNESPVSDWIKERKIYGGKNSLHVPIEKIQALADVYFSEWNVVDEKYFHIIVLCCWKFNNLHILYKTHSKLPIKNSYYSGKMFILRLTKYITYAVFVPCILQNAQLKLLFNICTLLKYNTGLQE